MPIFLKSLFIDILLRKVFDSYQETTGVSLLAMRSDPGLGHLVENLLSSAKRWQSKARRLQRVYPGDGPVRHSDVHHFLFRQLKCLIPADCLGVRANLNVLRLYILFQNETLLRLKLACQHLGLPFK